MSQRHRFLLLRDLDWSWFNALVFGMRDGAQLAEAVATLEAMREAALAYTRADGGWSTSVGLYLHCYPLNSVQALHLHIVDLAAVGPSYKHLSHKNLSLDAVLTVLREELDLARSPASVWEEPLLLGCAARSFDVVSACAQVVAGLVATGRRAGREGGPLLEPPAARLRSVLRAVWRFLAAADGRTQHSAAALWLRLQELAPAPAAQVLSYALRAADARAAAERAADRRRAPTMAWRWLRSSHGSRCCGAPLSSTRRRPPPPPPRRRTYTTQPTVPTLPTAPPPATRLRAPQRGLRWCLAGPTVPTPPPILRAPTAAAAPAVAAAAVRWRARALSRACLCYSRSTLSSTLRRRCARRRSGGCATPPPSLRRC